VQRPLQAVQQALRDRVNNLRCLERLVTTREFETAYIKASGQQQAIIAGAIDNGDYDVVQQWLTILERDSMNIEELPVRDLRKLASNLKIPGYHLLPRASLLSRIKEFGKGDSTSPNGTDCSSSGGDA
jgi:hypothetical protein